MAPSVKGTPKSTPQVHCVNNKSIMTKCTSSSPSKRSVITTVKKTADRIVVKETKGKQLKQNTTTPEAKENMQTNPPTSGTKLCRKPSWKRRPKPAHSGVPVPEKMRKLMTKLFKEENRRQTM